MSTPQIRSLGDAGVLLQWGETPSEQLLHYILNVKKHLSENLQCEVVHSYNELLLKKSPLSVTASQIRKLLETVTIDANPRRKLFTIPVCYGGDLGEDLEALSGLKQMPIEKIISLHTSPEYLIYFIGFLPGFLYLDGLNEQLTTPRKATPKLKVSSGSVAVGGNQTGIYPQESPGGWHIIGSTPLLLFDLRAEEPSPFRAGDKLKFEEITVADYEKIKGQVKGGVYDIKARLL